MIATTGSFPCGLMRQEVCNDPIEMEHKVQPWEQVYLPLSPGPFQSRFSQFYTGHMQMAHVTFNHPTHVLGPLPPDCVVLGLPMVSSGEVKFGYHPLRMGQMLAMLQEDEVDMRIRTPFTFLVFAFEKPFFDTLSTTLLGNTVYPQRKDSRRTLKSAALAGEMANSLQQAMQSVINCPDPLRDSASASRLETSILETLLLGLSTAVFDDTAASRLRSASQARDYIFNHFEHMVCISDICAAVGCTERTLHLGFLEQYGTTPKRYLKQVRYNEARRRLLRIESHQRVIDIAMSCGLYHEGRFSGEYFELFGEYPAQTSRQICSTDLPQNPVSFLSFSDNQKRSAHSWPASAWFVPRPRCWWF